MDDETARLVYGAAITGFLVVLIQSVKHFIHTRRKRKRRAALEDISQPASTSRAISKRSTGHPLTKRRI